MVFIICFHFIVILKILDPINLEGVNKYNVMIHSQERDLYFLKALSMKNKVEELWKRKSTN